MLYSPVTNSDEIVKSLSVRRNDGEKALFIFYETIHSDYKGSHNNIDIDPLTFALSRQGRGNRINFLPLDGG